MLIWGAVWGAIGGILVAHDGDIGAVLGGLLGLLAGWTLRRSIRTEIAAALRDPPAPKAAHPGVPPTMAESASPAVPQGATIAAQAPDLAPPRAAVAAPAPSLSTAVNTAPPLSAQPPHAPPPVSISPPRVPVQTARTAEAIQGLGQSAWDWLLGGNTIVRVGLVVLFVGLSFLVRYAAMAGLLPVELRLASVGLVGLALLVVGFNRRTSRPAFALALQGGGVGVLYLTVFAAFRLYDLLPVVPAFGLMVLICALSCTLALLQDSRTLATVAFAGGFAAPVLVSTGSGNHIALFSYYTVLNLAILFIATQRAWRVLNVLGFLATFGVATAWGVLSYRAEHYASAQAFLAIFVAIYIATALLYARQTPTRLGNAVDSTLVFGTPLVGFGLQAGLVQHLEMGTAFAALTWGAVYLCLAWGLARRARAAYGVLSDAFAALGVGFATLAVPLALDAQWTSAVWALEGAGAFWVGMRQARWLPRLLGLGLQLAAAASYAPVAEQTVWASPLVNPAFMGAMFIALPGLAIAWWLRTPLAHSDSKWAQHYARVEVLLGVPMFGWAYVFWCQAWMHEARRLLPPAELGALAVPAWAPATVHFMILLCLVASAALSHLLGRRLDWRVATWPGRLTIIALVYAVLAQWDMQGELFSVPGALVMPMALALHYALLRQADRMSAGDPAHDPWAPWTVAVHVASVWVVVGLLADGLGELIDEAQLWATAWASVVLLASLALVLWGLTVWAGRAWRAEHMARARWPLNPHALAYYGHAALPLAALAYLGALLTGLQSSGVTHPLPYIPLLNPTDLTLALSIGVLVLWQRLIREADPPTPYTDWIASSATSVALGGLAFVDLNTVWLRVAHHFFGVDWRIDRLFESFVVQTGYAILWSLTALALMVWAHRRAQRVHWLAGAALLTLVVVKLVLIDLSNAGGVERIVAFIVVGVLMLVVGYFAPLPPRALAVTLTADVPAPAPASAPVTASPPESTS